ncbi:putative quinol monooxygenase [Jatrophihabitans sp. GAS493]|uniref:putative quinol monooxygenase n=1 Tax=Jatrophihabitans sp. GAS493 TaxID=1907575 RepID=UPI000BB80734|nr:putative quinol monooxygenase [Jatrophihabitans sp. GAS493]
MIFIVVKFPIRPERSDEWPELVADFTAATRAEPGNLFFEWSRSADDPNEYVVVEAFRDDDAGAAHVNSAHFKTAMAWMPGVISATPKIINVTTPGDGWSAMGELAVG